MKLITLMGTLAVVILGGGYTWVTILACEKWAQQLIQRRQLAANSLAALGITIGLLSLDGLVLILVAVGLWALNVTGWRWAIQTHNAGIIWGTGILLTGVTVGILIRGLYQLGRYLRQTP